MRSLTSKDPKNYTQPCRFTVVRAATRYVVRKLGPREEDGVMCLHATYGSDTMAGNSDIS